MCSLRSFDASRYKGATLYRLRSKASRSAHTTALLILITQGSTIFFPVKITFNGEELYEIVKIIERKKTTFL